MKRVLFGACVAWLAPLLNGPCQGAEPIASAQLAGITAARIEADWIHADGLRHGAAGKAASSNVKPDEDAPGGVDGVKNGKWGFHTENEANPWWQVDLGEEQLLQRVVIFNRCDACQDRTSRIRVLLSSEGQAFHQAYQHDGTTFGGHPDSKPLVVSLTEARARYVRLQLPATSYFHLDEVEIYAAGGANNVALNRPATQSSVSEWSVAHRGTEQERIHDEAVALVLERGRNLAAHLQALGVDTTTAGDSLRRLAQTVTDLPADAGEEARKQLYLEARWTVRRLALRNPLLDFDAILFAKGAPTRFPHMSDQYYGWWSRPGGGIFVLSGYKTDAPRLRCLTADFPEGSFIRPELSYDARKVVFSYSRFHAEVPELPNKADKANVPEDAFYHVYEMNLDGTGVRRLTRGKYDDVDARYLPNGDIIFISTRKGTALQCGEASAMATLSADLPDSYVRCGGDNYRPVPVFTLHRMTADGTRIWPLSAFENFEWAPSVANDGRILFTRWDYIDRFNGHFFSLWACNQDGGNGQLVYGNFTVQPQVTMEARSIPGSQRLVFTASAHHSITGGSLVLLDRNRGTEGPEPMTRLTPEVPFPETEGWPDSYYANPYPLSEKHYLVAWSNQRLPPHCRVDDSDRNPVNATGVYLYDAFGNLELLYRDPEQSSSCPIPVRATPPPLMRSDTTRGENEAESAFLLQNVYEGLAGIESGSVHRLRIVAVPPKVQPFMNNPGLGVSGEDPGKYVLGTVPVEADGSAYFVCPPGIPVFFQALDKEGLAIQTMRSLTYVWPGQTLSCVGCHETRQMAPVMTGRRPLAARRAPSRIAAGPEGSWPLRYDKLVQPVLDRHCVTCHQPDGPDPKAAAFDLTGAASYERLLAFEGDDLRQLARERDRSVPGNGVALKSKLLATIRTGKQHPDLRLDAESLDRLVTWMDVYAQRVGHFSDQQEKELRELRERLAPMLAADH